jgi:hypothetical protein
MVGMLSSIGGGVRVRGMSMESGGWVCLIPAELALDGDRGIGIDGGTGSESSVAEDMAGRSGGVERKGDIGDRDGRAGRDMDGGGNAGRLGGSEVALLSVEDRLFDAGSLLFRVDSFDRFRSSSKLRRDKSACWV